ncbi:MAG: HYR domain-containing protein [Bacteroidetes bacterium]|nr:HYR domain-containing protein [Bacteroidota bacterium]
MQWLPPGNDTSGLHIPDGSTTVTYTVVDTSGNTISCAPLRSGDSRIRW